MKITIAEIANIANSRQQKIKCRLLLIFGVIFSKFPLKKTSAHARANIGKRRINELFNKTTVSADCCRYELPIRL